MSDYNTCTTMLVTFYCLFLGEEKLVAPLIAIPNVDKADRRQKERRKTKLALCVIRMQKGKWKTTFLQTNWTKS